jgi:hypothetical protein
VKKARFLGTESIVGAVKLFSWDFDACSRIREGLTKFGESQSKDQRNEQQVMICDEGDIDTNLRILHYYSITPVLDDHINLSIFYYVKVAVNIY